MTQQDTGRNNVTISMPGAGSVPIVSQTEINPMKTAISLMLALVTTTALTEPAARAEAAGGGRLVPARLRRALRTPSPKPPNGSCPVGMDCVGLVLLAKWPRAALAFAPASFSLSRAIAVPRGQPPRRLYLGAPEPGDEQEGAWPRERLERAVKRGEERPPMYRSAEAAE